MRYASEVTEVLGGRRVIGCKPTSDVEFIGLVRAGFPYESVVAATRYLALSEEDTLSWLNISKRTAARRKAKKERLKAGESERLLRLARAAAAASDVLGSLEKAVRWLQRSNRALGGEAPSQLLDTDMGFQQVLDELQRVEFGVFG